MSRVTEFEFYAIPSELSYILSGSETQAGGPMKGLKREV